MQNVYLHFSAFQIKGINNRKMQIHTISNEKGAITIEPMDVKRIIKGYCEKFYATNLMT